MKRHVLTRLGPVGLLAFCIQLHAETMFVVLKDQPSQDAVAMRLRSLGVSDIHGYTVINMLRGSVPASALRSSFG
jgi:hypothetical protein